MGEIFVVHAGILVLAHLLSMMQRVPHLVTDGIQRVYLTVQLPDPVRYFPRDNRCMHLILQRDSLFQGDFTVVVLQAVQRKEKEASTAGQEQDTVQKCLFP
eukprot:765255-Hanusia_phi.AAC.3